MSHGRVPASSAGRPEGLSSGAHHAAARRVGAERGRRDRCARGAQRLALRRDRRAQHHASKGCSFARHGSASTRSTKPAVPRPALRVHLVAGEGGVAEATAMAMSAMPGEPKRKPVGRELALEVIEQRWDLLVADPRELGQVALLAPDRGVEHRAVEELPDEHVADARVGVLLEPARPGAVDDVAPGRAPVPGSGPRGTGRSRRNRPASPGRRSAPGCGAAERAA